MLNVAAYSCCSSTIFFLPTAVFSKDISISFKLCRRSSFSAVHKSLGGGFLVGDAVDCSDVQG